MLFQLLTQSQRALSNIHTHLSSLDRNALTQFPKAEVCLFYGTALKETTTEKKKEPGQILRCLLLELLKPGAHFHPQKSLREVQQILNSTEGNFHQLVALLNCRGLNKVKKEKPVIEQKQQILTDRFSLFSFRAFFEIFAGLY